MLKINHGFFVSLAIAAVLTFSASAAQASDETFLPREQAQNSELETFMAELIGVDGVLAVAMGAHINLKMDNPTPVHWNNGNYNATLTTYGIQPVTKTADTEDFLQPFKLSVTKNGYTVVIKGLIYHTDNDYIFITTDNLPWS